MGQAKQAVAIGSRLEMMVDEFLIDSKQNVALQLQAPRAQEVVWRNEHPWEGPTSCYFCIIPDETGFRLYYRGGHNPTDGSTTCYAHSTDGIHFEKPELGLYEYEGSRANNIVFRGSESDSYASHNFAPFLDTNPDAPPEQRYKATGGYRLPDYSRRLLFAFASPDGIHWTKLQDEPILCEGKLDSLNIAFWDQTAGTYRCYSRYMREGGETLERAIQSCTSPDFLNWSPVQHNIYEEATPQFYTNATVPAPNAPHILLSFPMRYVPQRQKQDFALDKSLSDAMFMSSRDGVQWDRPFKEAWIRPGRDPYNWTDRNTMPAWGIAVTGDDEFSVYLSEHYRWPDAQLRRYTVRRDGFASLNAGATPGEWTTRPLLFSGSQLILNYATSAAGLVRVEVQDENGQTLPGFGLDECDELFGDELDAVVSWNGNADLGALQNRPVRLRFTMQEADLFALRFG